MKHRLIILLTKKYIQAAYFEDDKCFPLSFDGNKIISYSDEKDFKRIFEAVTGIYNLESLENVDLSAMIIGCGADSNVINKLSKLFLTIQECNIVFVDHVLPYILLCKGLLKKKIRLTVKILDICYKLDYHGQTLECIQLEEPNSAGIILEAHDFAPLFSHSISCFVKDEKLNECLMELEKWKVEQEKQNKKTIAEHQQDIAELKKQVDFLNNCAWSIIYWRYNNDIKLKLINKTESVCRFGIKKFSNKKSSMAAAITAEIILNHLKKVKYHSFDVEKLKFSFSKMHENGDIVQAGETIACIKILRIAKTDELDCNVISVGLSLNTDSVMEVNEEEKLECKVYLKTNLSGRLFYLTDSGDIGDCVPIALIIDKDVNLAYVDNIKRNINLPNNSSEIEIRLQEKNNE